MSILDDPRYPPELHDLAKVAALEHMTGTLFYFFSAHLADLKGMSVGAAAREFREGVKASMVEGGIDPDFLALMRAHAGKVLDQAVASADNADRLKGATPG